MIGHYNNEPYLKICFKMATQSLNPNMWITSYADFLFNYTITRVRDEETAKDIIQETFYLP